MFFFSASIHESSKAPLKVLRSIPHQGWNEEVKKSPQPTFNLLIFISSQNKKVERLFDQVRCETNSLTGMGFFNLTRNFLFGLFGCIFTFELILMEFDKVEIVNAPWYNCRQG